MDEPEYCGITIVWRKWMALAVLSIIMFVLSYAMAATAPDLPTGHHTALQAFHIIMMLVLGMASLIAGIGAVGYWMDT